MQALSRESGEDETTWFGLGSDVRGLCDGCHQQRDLIAQYAPTDHWFCLGCFHKRLIEADKDL